MRMPEEGPLEFCSARHVSVAIRAPSLGFGEVHGHDLIVEACFCGGRGLDVELVDEALWRELSRFHRRPLWEELGSAEALIEDLLLHLASRLPRRLEGARLCGLEARWPGRRIKLRV